MVISVSAISHEGSNKFYDNCVIYIFCRQYILPRGNLWTHRVCEREQIPLSYLPHEKKLDQTKIRAFADDKLY